MGSFDPIHVGHINMIRESLKIVDKVIVVPSGHNPWKKDIEPALFAFRVDMILASIKPFGERVEVSNIESEFEPPYYANKPLNYFKEKYKDDELYIICGSDTVNKIPHWKDAVTDILPFYQLICLERYDNVFESSSATLIKYIEDGNGKKYPYTHVYINPISVSSTDIRQEVKNGKPLYPLVTEEAENIIKKCNLYV